MHEIIITIGILGIFVYLTQNKKKIQNVMKIPSIIKLKMENKQISNKNIEKDKIILALTEKIEKGEYKIAKRGVVTVTFTLAGLVLAAFLQDAPDMIRAIQKAQPIKKIREYLAKKNKKEEIYKEKIEKPYIPIFDKDNNVILLDKPSEEMYNEEKEVFAQPPEEDIEYSLEVQKILIESLGKETYMDLRENIKIL